MFGLKALECLKSKFGDFKFGTEVADWNERGNIVLPVEIDKSSFSNGEKQIFIMAFYHSLVQLGSHEIPFVIDTPFARIDSETTTKHCPILFLRAKRAGIHSFDQ
jgi:hypothetical protein